MIELSLIPIVGILGVLAGGAIKGGKLPSRIALAVIFSYISVAPFTDNVYVYVAYAILLYGGMAPGHGQPIGLIIQERLYGFKKTRLKYSKGGIHGDLEWWQPEYLRFKPHLSLALRGLIHLHPMMVVSLPTASWLALKTPLVSHMDNHWRWWEFYKYSMAYALTLGALALI